MNAPLRFNEALIIAGYAFKPYQFVTCADQHDGGFTLSIVDDDGIRLHGVRVPGAVFSDPTQLKDILESARQSLRHSGHELQDWDMSLLA